MAFQTVPNGVEIVMRYRFNDVDAVNVLHAKCASVPTAEDVQAIAGDWDALVRGNFAAAFPDTVEYKGVKVRSLENESSPMYDIFPTAPVTGGLGPSVTPANVAFCLTLRTAMSGRSGRGRIYVPAPPIDPTSYNYTTGEYAAAQVAFWNNLTANSVGSPIIWTMAVLSRFTGGSKRPEGILTDVVNVQARDLRVDSQRRRLP